MREKKLEMIQIRRIVVNSNNNPSNNVLISSIDRDVDKYTQQIDSNSI
jgi:hypothetical protein